MLSQRSVSSLSAPWLLTAHCAMRPGRSLNTHWSCSRESRVSVPCSASRWRAGASSAGTGHLHTTIRHQAAGGGGGDDARTPTLLTGDLHLRLRHSLKHGGGKCGAGRQHLQTILYTLQLPCPVGKCVQCSVQIQPPLVMRH